MPETQDLMSAAFDEGNTAGSTPPRDDAAPRIESAAAQRNASLVASALCALMNLVQHAPGAAHKLALLQLDEGTNSFQHVAAGNAASDKTGVSWAEQQSMGSHLEAAQPRHCISKAADGRCAAPDSGAAVEVRRERGKAAPQVATRKRPRSAQPPHAEQARTARLRGACEAPECLQPATDQMPPAQLARRCKHGTGVQEAAHSAMHLVHVANALPSRLRGAGHQGALQHGTTAKDRTNGCAMPVAGHQGALQHGTAAKQRTNGCAMPDAQPGSAAAGLQANDEAKPVAAPSDDSDTPSWLNSPQPDTLQNERSTVKAAAASRGNKQASRGAVRRRAPAPSGSIGAMAESGSTATKGKGGIASVSEPARSCGAGTSSQTSNAPTMPCKAHAAGATEQCKITNEERSGQHDSVAVPRQRGRVRRDQPITDLLPPRSGAPAAPPAQVPSAQHSSAKQRTPLNLSRTDSAALAHDGVTKQDLAGGGLMSQICVAIGEHDAAALQQADQAARALPGHARSIDQCTEAQSLPSAVIDIAAPCVEIHPSIQQDSSAVETRQHNNSVSSGPAPQAATCWQVLVTTQSAQPSQHSATTAKARENGASRKDSHNNASAGGQPVVADATAPLQCADQAVPAVARPQGRRRGRRHVRIHATGIDGVSAQQQTACPEQMLPDANVPEQNEGDAQAGDQIRHLSAHPPLLLQAAGAPSEHDTASVPASWANTYLAFLCASVQGLWQASETVAGQGAADCAAPAWDAPAGVGAQKSNADTANQQHDGACSMPSSDKAAHQNGEQALADDAAQALSLVLLHAALLLGLLVHRWPQCRQFVASEVALPRVARDMAQGLAFYAKQGAISPDSVKVMKSAIQSLLA